MESVAKEMDNYGNDRNEPKRIKLENESVDVKLEDSQKCQPQPPVYNFSCHKCPDNFATREEIIHHWTESHGLHPSNCSVCNAHFPTSTEMWDHKVATHGIPCELCESLFETEEKLTDHVKSVHMNDFELEENGNQSFDLVEDQQHKGVKSTEHFYLDTYTHNFEGETGMACTLPTNIQGELETIPSNSQSQSGDTNSNIPGSDDSTFTCHLCPEIFQTMHQIKHHWHDVHHLKPSHCIFCKKPFPSRRLMGIHKKAEHGIICEICNKSFKKPIGLEEHVKVVHGLVKQSCCTICGMVFNAELHLKKHVVNFHSDVPGSIKRCDVCQYTCLTEEDMAKHKGKHMTYTCPECGMVLHSKGAAKRHRAETKHQAIQ